MIYNLYGGIGIDLSQLNNSASDILNGQKYVGSDGTIVVGNIPTLNSNTVTLTTNSSSTTISPGYLSLSKEINVRKTSVSAYTGAIPIASFSAEATVKEITGSNNSFITTVTGAPTNILAGFVDTSTIGSATDATATVGGSYILPGKSLGIRYKAGDNIYTYKVNSTLSNEEISNIDVGFANNVSTDLDVIDITPSANKVISKITVPENVGLVIYDVVPETSDNNIKLGEDNHILKGWNAIVGFKSDANTIKKGYITGTYEPSLQSNPNYSISFNGSNAHSQTIYPDSGYDGISSINVPSQVRMWIGPSSSNLGTEITTSSYIINGYNVNTCILYNNVYYYGHVKGTHSTSAKSLKNLIKVTHFTSAADSYTTYSAASGSSFSSVTNVPVNISLQFYTDAALSSLTCAGKTPLWTSSYIKKGQNLVARVRYGSTDATDLFVYYIEGSGS